MSNILHSIFIVNISRDHHSQIIQCFIYQSSNNDQRKGNIQNHTIHNPTLTRWFTIIYWIPTKMSYNLNNNRKQLKIHHDSDGSYIFSDTILLSRVHYSRSVIHNFLRKIKTVISLRNRKIGNRASINEFHVVYQLVEKPSLHTRPAILWCIKCLSFRMKIAHDIKFRRRY
jgi:hypothetical protein